MKKTILMIAVLALCFNTSCKKDKKEVETETENNVEEVSSKTNNGVLKETSGENKKLLVKLDAKSGSNVTGNAIFNEDRGIITMTAVFGGLTPGTHAIHIHEKADCSAADGTSSGGHWNPTAQPHGEWQSPKGYHKGDIGNFEANDKGQGTITLVTDEWCIGCGDATKDILGKAIIVHQGSDDFTTQPTGNAGGRVSCGGIIQ